MSNIGTKHKHAKQRVLPRSPPAHQEQSSTSMPCPLSTQTLDQFSMLGFPLDPKGTEDPPPPAKPPNREGGAPGVKHTFRRKEFLRALVIAYAAPTPAFGLVDQPRTKKHALLLLLVRLRCFFCRPCIPIYLHVNGTTVVGVQWCVGSAYNVAVLFM